MVRCAVLLLYVCTSDVVFYRLVRSAFRLAVRLERGFCACACICICAHAQLACSAVQRAARCQAVLRCTAAAAFWAIGLTEFLVAFRGVGMEKREERGILYISTYMYVWMSPV